MKKKIQAKLLPFRDLLSVAKFSFISTVFRLTLSLAIVKIASLSVGKDNFSNFYQFVTVFNIFTIFSIFATETGIVKLVAQFADNYDNLKKVRQVIFFVVLFSASLTIIFLLLFSQKLSYFFFNTGEYSQILKILAPSLLCFSFNKVFLAFLNGQKRYNEYYRIDIFQSILNILVFTLFTLKWGLFGAMFSYCIVPYFVFIFILFLNYGKINLKNIKHDVFTVGKVTSYSLRFNTDTKYIIKSLFYLAVYALVSMLVGSLLESKTRLLFITNFGNHFAATYDALNRFNAIFTVFTSSLISIYALPLFSATKDMKLVYENLIKICRFLFPPLIIISIVVYFFRNLIIKLLFSDNFLDLSDLVLMQLIGCLISTLNLILLNILITKLAPIFSITYSIVLPICYFILNYFSTKFFYVLGLPLAYLLNTFLSLAYLSIAIFYNYKNKSNVIQS